MGDAAAPKTNESMAAILQAYQQYLPDVLRSTATAMPEIAAGNVAAAEATADPLAKLQTQLYSTYGPQLAKVGAGIDLDTLKGAGGDIVRNVSALERERDPEYYQTRSLVNKGIGDVIGGMDPNRLSGSESSEIERGINRLNPSQVPAPLNTIQNAMTFGRGIADKQQRFEQAIGLAVGALPAFKSGGDILQQATGRAGGTAQ